MARARTQTVEERPEVRASAQYLRVAPRKARLVVEHIRGRPVPEARTVLAFTPRAAAREVEKILASAVANAEANHGLIGDDLIVSAAYVDEGPVIKRWRARARGRVARIQKKTCHVTIRLAPAEADGAAARAAADDRGHGGGAGGAAHGGAEGRGEAQAREPCEEACDGQGRGDGEAQAQAQARPAQEEDRGRGVLVGQKIHPGGMRVGVIHDWKSNWYTTDKDFADALQEDIKIREHIIGKLSHAGLSDILIRKDKQRITVDIYTARPGIVIGKSGAEVDALRRDLHALTQKNVHININEIKRPELDAKLVAQSIAEQLENRVSFRRAMKRSLASAIRSGAQGVKVQCGGRLGGGEMSRSESYSEGRVPLHTIRADIDYGFAEAKTTTGRIGVKVWINKGEIMPEGFETVDGRRDARLGEQDTARRRGGKNEGLTASRESGRRGGSGDREGLGPVRDRKPRRGRRGGAGAPGGRGARQDNVEKPRTDEEATTAEGRELPEVQPETPTTPEAVAEAPESTTPKTQQEDPTKLDQSGDESAEKTD